MTLLMPISIQLRAYIISWSPIIRIRINNMVYLDTYLRSISNSVYNKEMAYKYLFASKYLRTKIDFIGSKIQQQP